MARLSSAYQAVLRGYIESERVNSVSGFAEALYVRLLVVSDGHGRFHAAPFRVAADAMGRRMELGTTDLEGVKRALGELEGAGLIEFYEAEGRAFLQVVDYYDGPTGSRKRSQFPDPGPAHVPSAGTDGPQCGDEMSPAPPNLRTSEPLPPTSEGDARAREATPTTTGPLHEWRSALSTLAPKLDTPEVQAAGELYAQHRLEESQSTKPGRRLSEWTGAELRRDMATLERLIADPATAAACIEQAVGSWNGFKEVSIRGWMARRSKLEADEAETRSDDDEWQAWLDEGREKEKTQCSE